MGNHPEKGSTVFRPNDSLPEFWEPFRVIESVNNGGVLEIIAEDHKGDEVILKPGEWADRDLARRLWASIIRFDVESSKGITTYVVAGDNTIVYVPKCKLAIDTGLPDGSVMSSITGSDGTKRYTKCPYDAEDASGCKYPDCLTQMVTAPQPSIKAAKAAFRSSACVCFAVDRGKSKMLRLVNGPNHLNLVSIQQALAESWQSDYVNALASIVDEKDAWDDVIGGSTAAEAKEAFEKVRMTLMGEEKIRLDKADEMYSLSEGNVERALLEEEENLPENFRIKRKD